MGLRPPPRNYLISHLRIAVIHPIGEAPQNAPQGQQVDRPEGDLPGHYPPERVRRLNVGKRSPMVGSVCPAPDRSLGSRPNAGRGRQARTLARKVDGTDA